MHEFDAGYRNRRVSKRFEPQHRTQPKLDRSMVLFTQIIEVFRRSNLSPIAASMCGKKLPGRSMRRCYGASGGRGIFSAGQKPMERPMPKPNDCSRSVMAFEQNGTLIAVIEMSLSSWLVAG